MIRIVFTADNHLNRYYAKMSRDQLRERRRRIRDAWRKTVDFAIQRLNDHGVRILAISGNHDMPRYMGESATPIRIYEEMRAARVFKSRNKAEFEVFEIDGTRIAIGGLAPDPRADSSTDPLDGVEIDPPPADVRILLLHGGCEETVPPDFGDAIVHKSRIAALKEIDYFLMGDIHQTHKLNVEHATVLVPGSTERMTFGEMKEKPGFYYMELDGRRPVKLTRKELEPQPMRRLDI